MALDLKVGTTACPSGTGNIVVNTLGFQPKLIIISLSRLTAGGSTANGIFSYGAYDGTNQCAVYCEDKDNVGTSDNGRRWSDDRVAQIDGPGSAIARVIITATSMDAGGFTLNCTQNTDSSPLKINYMAMAGTDVEEAEVGFFNLTTGASQSVALSGGGFQPTGLILASAMTTNANNNYKSDVKMSLGFSDGTTDYAMAWSATDGVATTETNRYLTNTALIVEMDPGNPGTVNGYSSLNSFTATGFDLDHDKTYGTADKVMYIAIKGPQFDTGVFTTSSSWVSNTDISVGSLAFQPQGLLNISVMGTGYNPSPVDNHMRIMTGMASGAGEEGHTAMLSKDNIATSDANSGWRDEMYNGYTNAGVTKGRVIFKSWDTNGFTVTQTADENNAAIVANLVIGPKAASGTLLERTYPRGANRGITRGVA